MNTDWGNLKESIYFEDGSLRDIYILNTNSDDWEKWIDFVNAKYQIEFFSDEKDEYSNLIDFSKVKNFWINKEETVKRASIKINNFIINCHFFTESEIENDISPNEFKSIDDHQKLVEYMKEVSNLLGKKVIITPENQQEIILFEV